jgi:hypothetical protein
MADSSWKLPCSILFGALLACGMPTPERLLDEACRDQQCATSGSARQTTGVTSDSIGFEIGPGPGSVNVMVPLLPGHLGNDIELLARGSGSVSVTIEGSDCAPDCNARSFELGKNWDWISVGRAPAGFLGSTQEGFTLVVETSDDTSTAALLDVRLR